MDPYAEDQPAELPTLCVSETTSQHGFTLIFSIASILETNQNQSVLEHYSPTQPNKLSLNEAVSL